MTSPYKRRKPSIVRNMWVYRKLIALAMVLGLMLWFIWANNAAVTVAFPFGLGSLSSSVGLIILASALVGGIATALTMTVVFTIRRHRWTAHSADERDTGIADDRPPADYAAKTTEGFADSRWS
jgi:uncharacterized integral membrane protein